MIMLESQEKDQLYTALAMAQSEYPTIRVNRKAFKNEYADLYAILKPIYPILSKHGLSIRPWGGIMNDCQYIGARLMHKSGQFETNIFKFEQDPCKNPNDQPSHKKQGSITYFNRNHIKDMLGVLISDNEEDDDLQSDHRSVVVHPTCISKDQVDMINRLLIKEYDDLRSGLLQHYQISCIEEIRSNIFESIYTRIQDKIKERKDMMRRQAGIEPNVKQV